MDNYFRRYIWLIDLIRRRPAISFDEISEAWTQSELNVKPGKPGLSAKTFDNHKKAIADYFGIEISYNRILKGYELASGVDELSDTLLNSLSVNNLLVDNRDMKDRILLESIPSSRHSLSDIISAMRDCKKINLTYKKFCETEPSFREVSPYCLKLFKQRWYLLGNTAKGLRIFALDRIEDVEEINKDFRLPKKFNAEDYFRDYFGVFVDENVKPQKMELKVAKKLVEYFRTLPLHWSQKEVETAQDYSIFSYNVAPTSELCLEILSKGNNVEVLGPAVMRDMVISTINNMKAVYKL